MDSVQTVNRTSLKWDAVKQTSLLILLSMLALLCLPAVAQNAYQQSVGGYSLYLGIVPSEIVNGHAAAHPEATMHGGKKGGGSHHVMISIIDRKSGQQIANAVVEARVGELGLSVTSKKLEPMRIAGTTTYGNYFPMNGPGPFRIDVEFRPAGASQALSTSFNHGHPRYR